MFSHVQSLRLRLIFPISSFPNETFEVNMWFDQDTIGIIESFYFYSIFCHIDKVI